MDYETLYVLYQSRKTLLSILSGRGYNTTPFEKFGPIEINAMAAAGEGSMQMELEKKGSTEDNTPANAIAESSGITKCRVIYTFDRIKNRLGPFISDIEETIDPKTTEVIVMLVSDTIAEAFHTAALSAYTNRKQKLRISFFQVHQLVNNPLEHMLVPKHERVPTAEHDALMQKYKIKSKANLPLIRFHEDMIARILGLMPGDIVKITSASPSAGEYLKFRVCVP
jgi:DNA-directed RNA polymerase I, II, and III subunit RPABC1